MNKHPKSRSVVPAVGLPQARAHQLKSFYREVLSDDSIGLPRTARRLSVLCLELAERIQHSQESEFVTEVETFLRHAAQLIRSSQGTQRASLEQIELAHEKAQEFLSEPLSSVMPHADLEPERDPEPESEPAPSRNRAPATPVSSRYQEFKSFLEQSKNRRLALPQMDPPQASAPLRPGIRILKPAPAPTPSSGPVPKSAPSSVPSLHFSISAKQIYVGVAIVTLTLGAVLSFKKKAPSSELAALPATTAQNTTAQNDAPQTKAAAPATKQIAKPSQPQKIQLPAAPQTELPQLVRVGGNRSQIKDGQLQVQFLLSKADPQLDKVQGLIVIVSRGPNGIYGHPAEAIVLKGDQLKIEPRKGEAFGFQRAREVQATLPDSGSTQVEIYIYTRKYELINRETLQASFQKP